MQSLWMIFAALCFSTANLTIKLSSELATPAQILFFRGGIALIFVASWCAFKRQSLRTEYPRLHLTRSLSGVGSISLYTYGLTVLPMVTVVTLNHTAPVWLAIFMIVFALIQGTKLPRPAMLLCIGASMLGIILLLKPVFATGQGFAASLGLLSGFLSAVAYWQIKSLSKTGENATRIVFYHSLAITCGGILWWLFTPSTLNPHALPWLLITALLTLAGQFLMTIAVSKGHPLVTGSLMYLTVVFSAILGALFTRDGLTIDWQGYIGVALVVSCSIAATVLNFKASAKAPTANVANVANVANE
jgi:S-adenosylmethionine uptake transporter